MKASKTRGLLTGLGVVMVAGGSVLASPGNVAGVQLQVLTVATLAQQDEEREGVTATPATTTLLQNAGSYITVRVRRVAGEPAVAEEESGGRLIAVPQNARAGDPVYAEVPDEEYFEEEGRWDDGAYERTYGTAFAEGVNLGYTTLHRHGRPVRHPIHRPERDLPEFGSGDLHRGAVLRFGEAAQPRLDGLDDGFRRAQRVFHRATLTPGVRRESDGLRHERTGPRQERPPLRPRTQW